MRNYWPFGAYLKAGALFLQGNQEMFKLEGPAHLSFRVGGLAFEYTCSVKVSLAISKVNLLLLSQCFLSSTTPSKVLCLLQIKLGEKER